MSVNTSKLCPILNAKIRSQSKEPLPVIIQFKDGGLEKNISNFSSQSNNPLPIINGIASILSMDTIYRIVRDADVEYISFDSKVFSQLDIARLAIGGHFPHEWGYKGKGITTAIIDTGVAPHQDLVNPTNRIIAFKDFINNKSSPYDDNGHGTHIAGIIAGNGHSSGGKYMGIAPESNILAVKALDSIGSGNTSDIIAAISYAVENKDEYNIRILNLSLGSPANNPCSKDPLCRAVEGAVNAGLAVVVAAGNSGPAKGTILSPGTSTSVITVGALDDRRTKDPSDDIIARFSSRGPTLEGIDKPDLYAPGVNINSLSNTRLDGYTSLTGTSMATPFVTGAIAVLLNKDPTLSPDALKEKLLFSSSSLEDSTNQNGPRMIDLKSLFSTEENDTIDSPVPKFSKSHRQYLEYMLLLTIMLLLLESRASD